MPGERKTSCRSRSSMRVEPATPFGVRTVRVGESGAAGGYHLLTLLDELGPLPAPGQFYMLSAVRGWGGEEGRPFLPRAISYARADRGPGGVHLDFLLDRVGPGTRALADLERGTQCRLTGPLGHGFSDPGHLNPVAAGAILVGGGVGIAPIAALRRRFVTRAVPYRALLGFRDQEHSGGVSELFGCEQTRLAYEDGSEGHHGHVTDLLELMLAGDDVAGAAVYACGPPAMLERVRILCLEAGVPAELALESPMACGYGACYGCAVPKAGDSGYFRLCIDGPVLRADLIESAVYGGPAA